VTAHPGQEAPRGKYLYVLTLGALGVVYGDIGTSPLYALRECFHGAHAIAATPQNVMGVLSLIFWSLILMVSVKYLAFVLRADNRGEGGILALTALVTPVRRTPAGARRLLILLGLFGTALLYGDGMITPAITVLGAVEGLKVATPVFEPYVIPIAIVIIIGLFLLQSRGTGSIGKVFGPVMVVWFVTIASLGVAQILAHPDILRAINPGYGYDFFVRNGWHGFLVLGSVVLVVTGGESLYADLGHFGRLPIRLAWFFFVLPALMLNYMGQGALLVADPTAAENPFFRLAPTWMLYPLVALASVAAVIASQALISGAFSLTRQAVQLGYLPRVRIEHTSAREIGQIYVPSITWMLFLGCVALVLTFRSSTNLAAAYGIAVTGTMVITTILFATVAATRFRWATPLAVLFALVFLTMDLSFFGANAVKFRDGGWVPIAVASFLYLLMTTWKLGRQILADRLHRGAMPQDLFLQDILKNPPTRVPGTAVFMYGNPNGVPPALLHSLKHYKALHEQVVFLSVVTEEVPHVDEGERVHAEPMAPGFFRVVVHYGFMEDPDLPAAMAKVRVDGLDLRPAVTTYFLGRETLIASKKPGMAIWREKLFSVMSRNARPATSFFGIPPNRVVELGAQIEL
jgi:KUP system potassium uptake protein